MSLTRSRRSLRLIIASALLLAAVVFVLVRRPNTERASFVEMSTRDPQRLDALAEQLVKEKRVQDARAAYEQGLVAAEKRKDRPWMLRFLARLASFDAATSPAWDTDSQARSGRYCADLFERGFAWYARGDLRVELQATEPEVAELGKLPSFAIIPCARALLASRDYDRADEYAEHALKRSPSDVEAREIGALAFARRGRFLEALDVLARRGADGNGVPGVEPLRKAIHEAQALSHASGTSDPRTAARVALILGSPALAREAVLALLQQGDDLEATRLLAKAYIAEERFAEAEAILRKSAEDHPEDFARRQDLLELQKARAK